MNNNTAFDILKQTIIPFCAGQGSVFGADCVGLLAVYYDMINQPLDLTNCPRGVMHPRNFMEQLVKLGFVKDDEGEAVVFMQNRIGHCGLTDGVKVVHQDSVTGTTSVIDYYDKLERYTRRK